MVRSINGCPVSEFYKNPYLVSKAEGKEEEEHVIDLHNNTSLRITDLPDEVIVEVFKYLGAKNPEQLCTIRSVCLLWNQLSDDVLRTHWYKMCEDRKSPLCFFANAIEGGIGSSTSSYFFRFHLLTEEFTRMRIFIPKEDPKRRNASCIRSSSSSISSEITRYFS